MRLLRRATEDRIRPSLATSTGCASRPYDNILGQRTLAFRCHDYNERLDSVSWCSQCMSTFVFSLDLGIVL